MRAQGHARRPLLGALIAGALALSAAACGGGSEDGAGEKVTVDVGILPITSVAALKLGVEKGFFGEENIEVETHVAQSGAALVPAIMSGQYQFGFSNNVSLILAHGKGLPVRIVRTANSADSDPKPSQESLVVAQKSGIKSAKELEGKTVAVNSLNNTPHLAVLVTLDKAGVDTGKVKFVELGYPDMELALKEGRVDAADMSEPFLAKALAAGNRAVADPYREIEQDLHLSSWFTTQPYLDENKDVAERFARAVDKSNAYARGHIDEIRDLVPTYLDIEKETAQDMALPRFPEGVAEPESLERLAAASQRFGFVKSAPKDLDTLIAKMK